MRAPFEAIGAFLLVLASVVAFSAFFGQEITTWLHGAPPPDEQVRRDFEQALELPSSRRQTQVEIRRIGIAEHEGKWIRMYALFDAAAGTDVTVKVGAKPIHLKGGFASTGGEASLEYRRDASGKWTLASVTLDREPKPK